MAFDLRFRWMLLSLMALHVSSSLPACGQRTDDSAEPITLENVDKLGLLSETKRAARYIQLGPKPNELLFFSPNGIVVVDDKSLKALRKIENEQTPGFTLSRDRSMVSWKKGTKVLIGAANTNKTVEIDGGERPGRVAFSPDNKVIVVSDLLITGSEGEGSSLLRVFKTASGELIKKLEISVKGYGGLTPVFSPDGKILAVGNRNYETKLYDTKTWALRHTLPKRMTHEIAFSPDGKHLAAGYVDGSIAIWNIETGKAAHMVESGCHRIHSVAWNSKGDLLATSGPAGGRHGPNNTFIRMVGKVQIWNAQTMKLAKDLMDVQWSGSVRFTRDDTRLIATVTKLDTLDDGMRLAVWSTNAPIPSKPVEERVDVAKLPVTHRVSLPALAAPTVAVSADGRYVVAPQRDDGVAVWNIASGEVEVLMDGSHDWQVWRVAFSPDGSTVATASLDKTAKLWNAKTGNLLATLEGHNDRLKYVTYSPGGKYIFTSTGKQWPYTKAGPVSARIWDAQTGKLISELTNHMDTITSAIFQKDEKQVVVASEDHILRLWDVASGNELQQFQLGRRVLSVQLSPNGKKLLASSSGLPSNYVKWKNKQRPKVEPTVKMWDLATGKLLFDQPQPQATVASFNAKGDQILTACRGVITYWNAETGEQLSTHRKPLVGATVTFSPNGKYFLATNPEQPAELWSVDAKKQIRELEIKKASRQGNAANYDKPFLTFFHSGGEMLCSLTRAGTFRVWSLKGLE